MSERCKKCLWCDICDDEDGCTDFTPVDGDFETAEYNPVEYRHDWWRYIEKFFEDDDYIERSDLH